MSGIFFYTIGVALASGILFRSFFDMGASLMLLTLTIGIGLFCLWRTRKRGNDSPLLITALVLVCFAVGMARFEMSDRHESPLNERVGERVELEGVVSREPEVTSTSAHLYLTLADTDEIILVTTYRFKSFAYGDRVRVSGTLKKPESFETEYGRTFNYPGYLKARGVHHTISFAQTEVVGQGEGNWFFSKLLLGKQKFMESLEQAIPEPEAGLGEGLLLGVKRALGEELESAFRAVGIIHIVVLSGYNIMIVAEAIMRLLSFAFRPYPRMVFGILAIVCFAILVGLSATVVRASVMAGLLLIARATGRRYAVMRALMFAAVLMLLMNPYLIAFDPGFQLSFLATLGLIALSPIIEARLIRVPTKFGLREFLTATLSTQLFLLPFLTFLIGTFSVVSVVVNMLVLPMVPFAMLLTCIAGIAGFFSGTLGMLAGFPAYLSLSYIITIAEQAARLPFASFTLPAFPFWAVVLAYLCMGIGLYYLAREKTVLTPAAPPNVDASYDDWIIEEEIETPAAGRGPAAGVRDSLPFR